MNPDQPVRRVLQVHTRYRQAGGEDQVVAAEKQLLEQAGIDVRQVLFDNADLDDARSLTGDLRIAASAVWSRTAVRRVRAALVSHRSDVMHVHNTFAAASPSVFRAAIGTGVPVVHTLHNYRLVCPVATCFRDGHACTDCVGRTIPWPAVAHACVRGSRAQSAVATATVALHRSMGTFSRRIDAYIALTAFQRQLMVKGGLPDERIRTIPHFLEPDPGPGDGSRSGILFVGRLSEEKGVAPLLSATALEPHIARVAGSGPLHGAVEGAAARGQIDYLGSLARSAVFAELRASVALVVPSICFESFGLVVLEAYASGTPVIASRIGALAELVEDGVTGLLVAPGDAAELARRMRWAIEHANEMRQMGANARQLYEAQFRGPAHLAGLIDAYEFARQQELATGA